MYIFDVPHEKEVVMSSAFDHLRHLEIVKNDRIRVPLAILKSDGAQLNCGAIVSISSFVLDACNNIRQSIQTEGLFRKAGSSDCQKKIKTLLENGGHLEPHHHVIDVANLLKLFFRDLPEPLLPIAFHDVFISCLLLKDEALQGVLLTCLLLPTIHLDTIAYFMEFLKEVTVHHVNNKMDARNLAITLTPSLMPVEEKLAQQCGARLDQHVQIVQMLIEHAEKIGELPASISDKLSSAHGHASFDSLEECNNDRHTKKKKKWRSGSPTRMMVDKGSPEQEVNHYVTPTGYSTYCVKSAKKRKAQELRGEFSSNKKYLHTKSPSDKLDSSIGSKSSKKQKWKVSGESTNDGYGSPLPECSGDNADLLSSECVSHSISTGTDINLSDDECLSVQSQESEFVLISKSENEEINNRVSAIETAIENHMSAIETAIENHMSAIETAIENHMLAIETAMETAIENHMSAIETAMETAIENRVSAIENRASAIKTAIENRASAIKTAIENRVSAIETAIETAIQNRVSAIKTAIENRVSAIENRISQEFVNMAIESSQDDQQTSKGNLVPLNQSRNNANLVQSAYEKTLEESVELESSSTEQLAKRHDRDLKIRRSIENKVICSPSSRKIGTIRRSSRESAKPDNGNSLNRNQTWHTPIRPSHPQLLKNTLVQVHGRRSIRQGCPNTILTGLPQLTPQKISQRKQETSSIYGNISSNSTNLSQTQEIDTPHISGDYLTKSSFDINSIDSESSTFLSSEVAMTRAQASRVSSFNSFESCCQENISEKAVEEMNKTPGNIGSTPQNVLCRSKASVERQAVSGRASVVKIRNENAGMVIARTKLFEG